MSDWIDEVAVDKTAMSEVKACIVTLKKALDAMTKAEMQYEIAKEKYEQEVKKTSELLRLNGLEALKCEDGSQLELVQNVRCSISKSGKDSVAQWLRQQGAERLVKSQLVVDSSHSSELKNMGIAYDEEVEMNTNSVKAWVKGEMEMGNVSVSDLPKGLSWFSYEEVKWS